MQFFIRNSLALTSILLLSIQEMHGGSVGRIMYTPTSSLGHHQPVLSNQIHLHTRDGRCFGDFDDGGYQPGSYGGSSMFDAMDPRANPRPYGYQVVQRSTGGNVVLSPVNYFSNSDN